MTAALVVLAVATLFACAGWALTIDALRDERRAHRATRERESDLRDANATLRDQVAWLQRGRSAYRRGA